ncbi:muscle M-line assembly protein unc-89-like [Rhynchophorus ferrugineus]|uniref:muscle M-line assembly protein unc-89-like n=1 Tax=Rhynchophorus ferrugineus TaxID=354439 RepID=UPI003FCE2461
MGTFRGGLVLFVLVALFSGLNCLKDIEVVIPLAVRIEDTVTLQCKYDLEGDPLYTVKWYKGSKEFYRFIPKELPNTVIFPLPGINVDLSKSTPNEVVLRNVQPEVTGKYKCEVSSDAPNFYTKMMAGFMYVIDTPTDDPVLHIERDSLDKGDTIKGNCTAPPSYPATNISWYLNGKRIPESYTRKLEMDADQSVIQRRLFITSSGLDLQINDDTFQSGKAVLSCVSTLFNIYRGEKKEILEEAKEKPIPSSVLGPTDETSDGRRPVASIFSIITVLLIIGARR